MTDHSPAAARSTRGWLLVIGGPSAIPGRPAQVERLDRAAVELLEQAALLRRESDRAASVGSCVRRGGGGSARPPRERFIAARAGDASPCGSQPQILRAPTRPAQDLRPPRRIVWGRPWNGACSRVGRGPSHRRASTRTGEIMANVAVQAAGHAGVDRDGEGSAGVRARRHARGGGGGHAVRAGAPLAGEPRELAPDGRAHVDNRLGDSH
jgi:hypothetical protein